MRHLRILQYVDEVARTGSIRRAAEQLNFTASALTRRIMDIEAELGAPLFERTPRGMRLTPAGEMFVAHARSQLAEVERLRSDIADLHGMRRGQIRIACSQALALDFLPRAIADFRHSFPDVTFDVRVADHERATEALVSYEVDIVLVFQPAPLAEFQQLAAFDQHLVALMPPDHPLAGQKTLRLRDCARHPVALSDRSTGGRQIIERFSERSGVAFDIALESNSFELLRQASAQAGLISFQIAVGAPAEDFPGLVVRPIDRRDAPAGTMVLGQLRGRTLPVACAAFVGRVRERMIE